MRRRAFTLIETLVVVIIIGVLASVAIRTYLDSVEKMRGAEPREVLLRAYAGYCRLLQEEEPIGGTAPLTWARLGMDDPALNADAFFTYRIQSPANPQVIVASRKGAGGRQFFMWLGNGTLTKTAPY